MSFQAKVFLGQAAAFLVAVGLYLSGLFELAGVILLGGCAVFGVWVGAYLLHEGRSEPEFDTPPPEGEIGRFPSATRWTPLLALAIVVVVNGVIAGRWLLLAGAGALVVAVIGYTREFSTSTSEPTEPSEARINR